MENSDHFDTTDCEFIMTDEPRLDELGKSTIKAAEVLEKQTEKPAWKEYIDQFTDEELIDGESKNGTPIDYSKLTCTAEDFKVDPDDYPIFNTQSILINSNNDYERWNIDKTLSNYLGFTANTIAALDGSTERPRTDVAIYLDKSARPVQKLVHALWNDFAAKDEETGEIVAEPDATFLNIDRLVWSRRVGLNVDDEMHLKDNSGVKRKAGYIDFKKKVEQDGFRKEDLAAIRALFIEGGRTTDNIDEIMQTPTILDGKNITIIDEVSDTGATIDIAKDIIKAAVPEAASVNGYVFSNFGTIVTDSGSKQMAGSPVWYPKDHDYMYGREVLDPDEHYWKEAYEKDPTPENYAKLKAFFVMSTPMNLEDEPEKRTLELYREINQLAEDYHNNKVLFRPGLAKNWYLAKNNDDYGFAKLLRQGINPMNGNIQKISEKIDSRPPIDYYSKDFPVH
jgi:hypoxanthine phosphoribosyltransferase